MTIGVLLADSEFRHELEADVEPFKGLLLGLFFMTVGLGVNLTLLAASPLAILGAAIGLLVLKFVLMYAIARVTGRSPKASGNRITAGEPVCVPGWASAASQISRLNSTSPT